MLVLVGAVVLVGVLCTVDLLLTVGVIRRLREHTELLAKRQGAPSSPSLLQVGDEIGGFAAISVDGEVVRGEALSGETLAGFFTTQCGPCKEQLPDFVKLAREMPGGRDRVLAVAVGTPDATEELVAQLRPVARVVVEGFGGELQTAFQVKGYPSVLRIASVTGGPPVVTANQVTLDEPGAMAV